jgi:hypothetical protein
MSYIWTSYPFLQNLWMFCCIVYEHLHWEALKWSIYVMNESEQVRFFWDLCVIHFIDF